MLHIICVDDWSAPRLIMCSSKTTLPFLFTEINLHKFYFFEFETTYLCLFHESHLMSLLGIHKLFSFARWYKGVIDTYDTLIHCLLAKSKPFIKQGADCATLKVWCVSPIKKKMAQSFIQFATTTPISNCLQLKTQALEILLWIFVVWYYEFLWVY